MADAVDPAARIITAAWRFASYRRRYREVLKELTGLNLDDLDEEEREALPGDVQVMLAPLAREVHAAAREIEHAVEAKSAATRAQFARRRNA